MAPDHRDAGRVVARLMVGRPVDGAALQKCDLHSLALDHGRGAGLRAICAGSGMRDADAVEIGDRLRDGFSVIDVVGETDGGDPALGQRSRRHLRVGEEALDMGRAFIEARRQAALEIGEHEISRAECILDASERNLRVGDVHEIDVTGDDKLEHLNLPCCYSYSTACCGYLSYTAFTLNPF